MINDVEEHRLLKDTRGKTSLENLNENIFLLLRKPCCFAKFQVHFYSLIAT